MTAIITGATRGLGYAIARQLAQQGKRVWVTGRDGTAANEVAKTLHLETGANVVPGCLDVTDPASCHALMDSLVKTGDEIDILVNNAGIFPDLGSGFFDVDERTIRHELEVHFFGAWRLTHALLPGMLTRGYGRIVNLTSGYGATGMGGGMTGYRIAKAAINALTQITAAETEGNVKINAVDPGWVATDLGGEQAPRTPAEAAADIVHAATLAACGPNGALLRHQQVVSW